MPDFNRTTETRFSARSATIAAGSGMLVPAEDLVRPVGGISKRVLDVAGALVALVLLLPAMIVCAIAVKVTSRGPVFFAHKRLGFGGAEFPCLKFRTMYADAGERLSHILSTDPDAQREWAASHKLTNDPRVTRLGAFMRKTSLDELPQLFNVLVGHMSLVGPRPIVKVEVERYGSAAPSYFAARPGVSGAWQVSGRSSTTYDERVAMDVAYVNGWTLAGDIKILFKTFGAVLRRDGAY